MNAVIGIDPGLSGALAVMAPPKFAPQHPVILEIHDLPVVARAVGKGNQLDAHGLCALLLGIIQRNGRIAHAYVEAVGPMPKQGVTSMFSLGRTVGAIEGVIAACGVPMSLIEPKAWKRAAGLLKQEKDASRTRALQLFPAQAGNLTRAKDHGRAEAMLIARHGWVVQHNALGQEEAA